MSASGPSTYSIALADAAAIGHYNAGLSLYRSFANPPQTAMDEFDRFSRAVQFGVPAITNLALGLELFLKLHHFQIFGVYPRGHDIAILGLKFPSEQLETLRSNYARLQADPRVDKGLEFRVSTRPPDSPGAEWRQADTSTYDLAIEYIGAAYVRWRYIYEEFRDSVDVSFAFSPLYLASTSVNEAIRSFRGNVKIQAAE